jgi:hypothetical protein
LLEWLTQRLQGLGLDAGIGRHQRNTLFGMFDVQRYRATPRRELHRIGQQN